MFKEDRTVVGDKVPEVILRLYDLENFPAGAQSVGRK